MGRQAVSPLKIAWNNHQNSLHQVFSAQQYLYICLLSVNSSSGKKLFSLSKKSLLESQQTFEKRVELITWAAPFSCPVAFFFFLIKISLVPSIKILLNSLSSSSLGR